MCVDAGAPFTKKHALEFESAARTGFLLKIVKAINGVGMKARILRGGRGSAEV